MSVDKLVQALYEKFKQDGYDLQKVTYLDYQASTPCDPKVLSAMMPFFSQVGLYGNPHARSHVYGWMSEKALEYAREQVAKSIGTTSECIIFTSGATESNNLAIKGLADFWKSKKKHIISTEIEHKCVIETLKQLNKNGFDISYANVDSNGMVDLKHLESLIRSDTLLITISAVNHEIGTVQNMSAIGNICKKHDVFFHVDAAQAWGKIIVDVEKWNADMMSLSAHKTYGPKGIGVLYLRCSPKRVRIHPLFNGGGQERGFRSGTTPVTLCIGMGQAAELFCTDHQELLHEYKRMLHLHQLFINGLSDISHLFINGPDISKEAPAAFDTTSLLRIPHNINLSVLGVEGESLMLEMRQFAFASGSACTSANLEPSYILRGIGVKEELLHSSIRISFGRQTMDDDVLKTVLCLRTAIAKLRDISPVWDCIVAGKTVDSWNIDS